MAITRIILLGFIVIIIASLITAASSNTVLYGSRSDVSSCIIEDCLVAEQFTGFPLKVYKIEKYEGINCSHGIVQPEWCSSKKIINPLSMVINLTFYIILVGAIFFTISKVNRAI